MSLTNSNFGLSQVNDDYLTFSWNDENLSGKTLIDSSFIFSFLLKAKNVSGCKLLYMGNKPTTMEVIDNNLNSLKIITTLDSICQNCDSCFLDLGNDTVLCGLNNYLIEASTDFSTYYWENFTSDSSSLLVDSSGIFILHVTDSLGCQTSDTININLNKPILDGLHIWNGSINNDWFNNCNWNTFHVPDLNDDVLIDSNYLNYPDIKFNRFVSGFDINDDGVIDQNDLTPGKAYCKTLTIQDGMELFLNSKSGAELFIKQ